MVNRSVRQASQASISGLVIIYTNCHSLVNKREELRQMISDMQPQPHVITLTETWTNQAISNSELQIPGYILKARRDRTDTDHGRGGGIITYIMEGVTSVEINDPLYDDFNATLGVQINTKKGPVKILTVYRSPNSTSENNAALLSVMSKGDKSTLYVGDFNYRNIDWENLSGGDPSGRSFVEFTEDNFLTQHVFFPRGDNTLDLILTRSDLVCDVRSVGKLSDSDHDVVMFKVNAKPNVQQKSVQMVPNYSRADFARMRREVFFGS